MRLKDNNCHVDESERVLKKKEKFSELIILYEKKGLHQKGKAKLIFFILFLVYLFVCYLANSIG